MVKRDKRGRFSRKKQCNHQPSSISIDHNYVDQHYCEGPKCTFPNCASNTSNCDVNLGKNVKRNGWKVGRRVVEFDILLSRLRHCKFCGLGPVPLTYDSVVGEIQRGLGGYLYVRCSYHDCNEINIVPYGKTHQEKSTKGIPNFVVNTKLGLAMIDSVGGPDKVNNLLSTLNMKTISNKNLKCMERRSGKYVESFADKCSKQAAKEA